MLIIKRNKFYKDSFRGFKIFLDGNYIGNVKNSRIVSFDISEGVHKLKLKIDWCSSNTIEFNYINEDITFTCNVSPKSNIFKKYSLDKDDYLILKLYNDI